MFQVATWNVNSIRVRLPQVLDWLQHNQPDVLALQEIKVTDAEFPYQAFIDLGYQAVTSGQKTYNGVALLYKAQWHQASIADNAMYELPDFADDQRRVLGATINDVFILNLYVPNGSTLDSDKYHYKLAWLDKLYDFLADKLPHCAQLIVLGDFNIAPQDQDVHDPNAWLGQVLVSPAERQVLQRILSLGFTDSYRWAPKGDVLYTWWDYRKQSFQYNQGLRIDHIFCSNTILPKLLACEIDTKPRGLERPSDHAPVIATFAC